MKFALELLQHITRVINKVHFGQKRKKTMRALTRLYAFVCGCHVKYSDFLLKKKKFNSHDQKLWERR